VSEAEMKIGALAPWFGGKRNMAPLIAEELGPHHSYREPFCGSMAVLLSKPRSRAEIANDLHGDLVNLARCVQHPRIGPALYRRLRRVLCAEALFRESLTQIRMPWDGPALEGGDPERAFHYFVASWQGMNGVAGTPSHNTGFCRRFSSLGGDPGTRWAATVRSIPAWRRRLEGVQVLSTDGIALCEKIEDREGTAIYVDPPYLVKGAKYLHDFADADHLRLAEALRRFRRTRVVVSYYEHPRLAELYPGWGKRTVEVAKSIVNQRKRDQRGATKAAEVLLVNGPLAGGGGQASLFGDAS
jgi:DNA adenine methylase